MRDGFSAYKQRGYKCGCCEVIVIKICSSSHNFHVFGLYRHSALSEKVFDCLLTAMAKVQSVNRGAPFLFVGSVNAYHEEWLGSSTTNLHRKAACDCTSSSDFVQMVKKPSHFNAAVITLVLTDVPDVVEIRVGSPIGTSNHSFVFIDVVLKQPISQLVCRQEVYLKTSVDWELVREDVKHAAGMESLDQQGVVAGCRLIRNSIGWLVGVLSLSMKTVNKHSRKETNHS